MNEAQGIVVAVLNGFLAIIGTIGNSLIIFAVLKTPVLRQRPSNGLLLSLAVADLVVTMFVQLLYVPATVLKMIGSCNIPLEMTYHVAGVLSGSGSAFHLAAISIDRAISAVKPHDHRRIMKKWSKWILAICWGSAGIFAGLFLKYPTIDHVNVSLLVVCAVVMISSYGVILFKAKRSSKTAVTTSFTSASTVRERSMENRMSGTIAIVIALFILCWSPIVVVSFAHPEISFICSVDVRIDLSRTLLMANSSMNFIIYSLKIRQFRCAYYRLIRGILQLLRGIIHRLALHDNTTLQHVRQQNAERKNSMKQIETNNTARQTKEEDGKDDKMDMIAPHICNTVVLAK